MGPKRKKKSTKQYEIKKSTSLTSSSSRNCLENSFTSSSFLEDSIPSLPSLPSLHSLEHKGNDHGTIGISSIDSISVSVSGSAGSGSGSGSSSQNNHEALKKFIESGGKKCFELFQYLSSSTHWRKYGTLPPLNDQEAAMLNHMYQLWLQNQVDQENESEDNDPYDSHSEDEEDENGSTYNDSQGVSIITCISTIKDTILQSHQYSDSLLTLLTQLDLLMKSPEPCRTHASDLLEIFMLPEFLDRDVNSLERMFSVTETHSGYISACSIALGLLAECEHLISSQIPSYETYLGESKNQITEEHYYNNIALQYYLKSNQLSSQFPTSASGLGLGSPELIQNSIACMQLGSLYLRGGSSNGEASERDTLTVEDRSHKSLGASPDYQAAYDYYKFAAVSHNPIAQHKVGYFYDEGLPNGVCNVDIMEAVKWYSLAAELMPDSMHNLAKIYEDGRGGFEPDMTQAVTLYSVAAARGFPLSQVNLGRLFLLGEDGVTRDREAGKRLLTLAAESGDADAQMVVGMIHATPAFECYDLKLSEHWLRQSLAGGKLDAERLLVRVCQQMAQQSNQDLPVDSERSSDELAETTPTPVHVPISQNAQAAKRRGDDFVSHGLLHAAVLEYSRAFELDRSQISYFVDRLDALCILGHYEETLTDSSLLLLCVDSHGLEYSQTLSMNSNSLAKFKHRNKLFPSSSVMKKELDFFRAGLKSSSEDNQFMEEKMKESQDAMDRLYDILVESLGCLFCASNFSIQQPFAYSRFTNRTSSGAGMNSADTGGLLDSYNSLFDQTISAPSSEFWPSSGSPDDFDKHYHHQFFDGNFDQDNDNRQQYQQIAEDYMFNLHQHHREPIVCRLLQDCMDWELKSTKSSALLARLTSYDRYYTSAVIKFGGIPILLSVLSYPSQWSAVLSQAADAEKKNTPLTSKKSVVFDAIIKKHILHEQLWLNCSIILHNLSFSHMAKKVMYLLSATDGFPIMCNCLRLCRDKIQSILSDPSSYGSSIFRCIALARISTTITQILLSSACLGREEIWDELMVSDLVGGLSAALECAIHAAQIESDSNRIRFLQQLQHLPTNSIPQNKLQHILVVRETCLEEVDRILMDTVHTMARLLKIAPTFVLTSASSILMIPFQRILVAITSRPGNSETTYDGLKSATAFCLCKLLCARDPRNAELLQQSLSKDGIRDILMLHESQPDPLSELDGSSKKIKSNGLVKSDDPISPPTASIQSNLKGSTPKTTPISPSQPVPNNSTTIPAKSNSKKKKGSS